MSEPVRVAVVGLGIGRAHLDAYRKLPERFEVVAVCDLDAGKAADTAARYDVTRSTTELGELLEMAGLEVVDLCTPPHLHFAQIGKVLRSGKHAICEKPLVGSLQEANALAALEAESGKRVMPIFQYRFGHGLQKLKHLVERGVTGKAFTASVETAWRRRADYYEVPWRGKWRTELGGALVSHALHAHDMLSYVLGGVRRVSAFTSTRVNPIEVEDCAAAALEMNDGSLASLSVTLGSAAEISRHRFCFEHLTAESNTSPYTNSSEPWLFTSDSPEAKRRVKEALADFTPLPEGYEGQFHRFYDALKKGGELPVTLGDARASLELVTALYHAAETGCAVSLPLAADHPRFASWLPQGVGA